MRFIADRRDKCIRCEASSVVDENKLCEPCIDDMEGWQAHYGSEYTTEWD